MGFHREQRGRVACLAVNAALLNVPSVPYYVTGCFSTILLPTVALSLQHVSSGAAIGLMHLAAMAEHWLLLLIPRAFQYHPVAKDVKKGPSNRFLLHLGPSSHSPGN